MTLFETFDKRINRGEVIILDGAIGTQLQEMGLPIYHTAWAATALNTHPATVQVMHEQYIKAGVDIITTNTYASARHNLEPLGLAELTGELNRRAVLLAREARDKMAHERPVTIAGSISNFGMRTAGEDMASLRERSRFTDEQLQANLREQAETLLEAGVDFLLPESTGTNAHRKWVSDACRATGAPFWVGFNRTAPDAGSFQNEMGRGCPRPIRNRIWRGCLLNRAAVGAVRHAGDAVRQLGRHARRIPGLGGGEPRIGVAGAFRRREPRIGVAGAFRRREPRIGVAGAFRRRELRIRVAGAFRR